MYTVISYNNSRKNGTVKFLEVFSSCVKAIRYARKQANSKYGEKNVTVDINNILIKFTSPMVDGIEMDVFAVVTLPKQKENEIDEIIEENFIDKESEAEKKMNVDDEKKMNVDDETEIYDEYEKYGEIYDDRYDEREDDGYNGGYEDECFECLDF